MSTMVFKRLFEIQILHDYFLTSADGTSFFDGTKAEKTKILKTKLSYGLYDVNALFRIEPTETTKQKMKEHKLIMSRTALGFVMGMEVYPENLAGETLYTPRYAVNNGLNLSFSMISEFAYLKSITNMSFKHPLSAIYYFTNKDKEEFDEGGVPADKSLPLSDKAMAHQNGKKYEMGALIDFGGTVREAVQHTDGNDPAHWEDMEDKRFISDGDRKLLPHIFNYVFEKEDNVTQLEVMLEDKDNLEVKTITRSSTEAMQEVPLNFAKIDENDEDSEDIPGGFYRLKVKINGGEEIIYPVYLNRDLYQNSYLGVIEIRFDETDSPFSLLDASGFLRTRIDTEGQKIPHPVFELRFKNRRTYWRYSKTEGVFEDLDEDIFNDHFDIQPSILTAKRPKALTEKLVPFKNGETLMLPHPETASLRVGKEKIFSEIFINQSNRLLSE